MEPSTLYNFTEDKNPHFVLGPLHQALPNPAHQHQQQPMSEAYCVRWRGFQGNFMHYLSTLRSDEDFSDVTLACDQGVTVPAHRLVLASCSPYFRRILQETPCQHPVIILNEVTPEVLEALMTYMYSGQVFLTEEKLNNFFKVAAALEVKGIQEFGVQKDYSTNLSTVEEPLRYQASHQHVFQQPPTCETPSSESTYSSSTNTYHPVGDLSLLAAAATSTFIPRTSSSSSSIPPVTSQSDPGGPVIVGKRRKTVPPRRLENVAPEPVNKKLEMFHNDENSRPDHVDNYAINLSTRQSYEHQSFESNQKVSPVSESLIKQNSRSPATTPSTMSKSELLNVPNPLNFNFSNLKEEGPSALDMSKQKQKPFKNQENAIKSTIEIKKEAEEDGEIESKAPEGRSRKESKKLLPVSSNTTPEQLAALLGPSWKSRQPRMCQYCQRMFSNKFNLKQHILNMHTVGRELHCEICQKKVKNKWYLRRHHVTHHGAPLKK